MDVVAPGLWSNSCTSADAGREGCGGTLLLTVLGGGNAAGSSSPACLASSPAEIMEQRLSNRHPGLMQLRSPHCVLPARGAWEDGLGVRDGDGCRWLIPLPPPGEREWKAVAPS